MNPLFISRFRFGLARAACVAGVSLLSSAGFAAQTTTTQTTTTTVRDDNARTVRVVEKAPPLKRGDREFLEKVAKASMAEVQISRIAASRTTNPDVRRFAQMMIDDHESANEQLAALASARGVALPAKEPNPDRWEKHDAKSFDKDYMAKMVSDHEDVVKLFEKQAKNGEDADTVAFARKHLPKMQQHLQHAVDLKRVLSDKRR